MTTPAQKAHLAVGTDGGDGDNGDIFLFSPYASSAPFETNEEEPAPTLCPDSYRRGLPGDMTGAREEAEVADEASRGYIPCAIPPPLIPTAVGVPIMDPMNVVKVPGGGSSSRREEVRPSTGADEQGNDGGAEEPTDDGGMAVAVGDGGGAMIEGGADGAGQDERVNELEGRLQKQRSRMKMTCAAMVVVVLVAVVTVLVLTIYVDDRDNPEAETAAATPSPTDATTTTTTTKTVIGENPCSSYDGAKVVAAADVAESFCGRELEEGTAYILEDDASCENGNGPTLPSGACLDCRGNSITGIGKYDGGGSRSRGIYIPPSSSNAAVHNCVLENFWDGIQTRGNGARISNVRVTENLRVGIIHSGMSGGGGMNNVVECSDLSNNNDGIYSLRGGIDIARCSIEKNDSNGAFLSGANAVVSCSEIRSSANEGVDTYSSGAGYDNDGDGDAVVVIRDSVVADSRTNIHIGDGSSAVLAGTAACNAGGWDIYVGEGVSVHSEGLTCDDGRVDGRVTCDERCPSSSSSLTLPDTCPLCRHGVGPYTP